MITFHPVLGNDHFASIEFLRTEPVIWMGVLVLVFQGAALSFTSYSGFSVNGSDWKSGLLFGLTVAVVLVGYIAVVEPSKYIASRQFRIGYWWKSAGLLHLVLYGILIGLLYLREIIDMPFDPIVAQQVREVFSAKKVKTEEKKMMGGLTFMVKGKMCVGVLDDELMARIDPEVYEASLKEKGLSAYGFYRKTHEVVCVRE